eukprot:scaffold16150_cov46-Phaeocystis_antarctica.AAC.4
MALATRHDGATVHGPHAYHVVLATAEEKPIVTRPCEAEHPSEIGAETQQHLFRRQPLGAYLVYGEDTVGPARGQLGAVAAEGQRVEGGAAAHQPADARRVTKRGA